MTLDQKRARWFGVLYLLTFVTSIPALVLYEPALRHPVAFIAGGGNVNKIYLGALLELLLILANIGTAVVIVPIMPLPERVDRRGLDEAGHGPREFGVGRDEGVRLQLRQRHELGSKVVCQSN